MANACPIDELLRAATVPENKFVLSFDDGTLDHYEIVLPMLRARAGRECFSSPPPSLISRAT